MASSDPASGESVRILILEDEPLDAELEIRELRRAGLAPEWTRVETESDFADRLRTFEPELVLADFSLPGWNGLAALRRVREQGIELPFIVVTGSLDEETAADCIKAGADDYVLKERLARLPYAVRSAREAWATRVARRRAEDALRLRNAALEATANGIVITDANGTILWVNPAFGELTGYSREEAAGRNPRILKSGVQTEVFYRQMWETITAGGVWRGELLNRRKDGSLYLEEMTITPVRGAKGSIEHFVAVKQDTTARHRQEEVIRSLATRDLLTGLSSQAQLRLDVEKAAQSGESGALVMLDIDRFALLNDALGHSTGDRLLVELAGRLAERLPEGATLYRFGGDELAVLASKTTLEEAEALAEELRRRAAAVRVESEGTVFDVTVSAGLAPIDATRSGAAALALADAALQAAKTAGRDRIVTYRQEPAEQAELDELGRWAARLKDALRDGQLRLVVQKIVALPDAGSDRGEALVRMVDDSGGLIPPGSFLPAAERFGLVSALDRWVVETAVELLASGKASRLFVNLSGSSLGSAALLSEIEALVVRAGLPPGALTFEITETAAIADITGLQRWARRLKELGCSFALDDFGTGFSSFAYLQNLPVDLVKIDGSFVYDLDSNPTNRALVQAMVTVAHALGKAVIAEKVERQGVADILAELGVEFGQGWLWGKPVDPNAAPAT
ncbi:MAG: EAL domain-containing protein [Holophagales bacterium]|nr:MAG: EAL domain-containing protein [Holophagales bacterium]